MKRGIALLAVFALIFSACDNQDAISPQLEGTPTLEQGLSKKGGGTPTEPANHFVVEFNSSVDDLTAAVEALGGTVDRAHPEIGVAKVSGLTDAQAAQLKGQAAQHVTRDLMVQWIPAAEDFDVNTEVAPEGHVVADPTTAFFYPCQWNMSQINGPGAWAQGEFGAGATVAVLDTGVNPTHIDLAGRVDLANSTSMLSAGSSPCGAVDEGTFDDFNFHGSFVSGIVAGNGFGVTGVAPDATILGVKVLSCVGSGSFADVIAGILYAANLQVDVINMSLGARFPKNSPGASSLVSAMNKAVNYAGSQGVLVVSSAGNNGVDLDHDGNFINVPAQSGSGISAWAGDVNGNLAGYSNHGLSGVWVGAGGGSGIDPSPPLAGCVLPAFGHGGIISVCSPSSIFFGCGIGSFLFNGSGTSFSAPAVSGVAALVDGKNGGALNGGQLKTILKNTADDLGKKGADNTFSHGRVNAGNAVQ